jgi:putative endonuclease
VGSPEGTPSEESHPLRMFYAYILKSVKDGGYYYGSTSNIEDRLRAHNMGKVRSTKGRKPWKLHYFEEFESRLDAVRREMFFKTIDGYNWLKSQKITEK